MFETMHRLHRRGTANRGVCVDADGAMLGPDWSLVERTSAGYCVASRTAANGVQKALLAGQSAPDWLYEQGLRIARALNRGELALAQIYGLRIPIGEVDQRQLKRLAALTALHKVGFDPDEPRVPSGEPGGGEWTTGEEAGVTNAAPVSALAYTNEPSAPYLVGGRFPAPVGVNPLLRPTQGEAASAPNATPSNGSVRNELDANVIEAGYNLSPDLLAIMRALYRIYVTPGSTLASLQAYLAENGINFDELPSVIKSLFDSPKPLAQLQTDKPPAGFLTEAQLKAYVGDPPPGYEWHHIIEQNGQFRPDLTSLAGIQEWIQNTTNLVAIPVIKHYCVSGIMSKVIPGSNARVRDVVKFHSPAFQREVGLELLRRCGALL